MDNSFLLKEYELNYEQLRFYDSRQADLFQYLFTLTSSVAAAQFAIYEFFKTGTSHFYWCAFFLSVIVYLASILLYAAMLQNRLYFVFTARQLNAIRGYFLTTEAADFKQNQLYTAVNFPAVKLSSVHTIQLIGASWITAMFVTLSVYMFCRAMGHQAVAIWILGFVFVLMTSTAVVLGYLYLDHHGKRTADDAVHKR